MASRTIASVLLVCCAVLVAGGGNKPSVYKQIGITTQLPLYNFSDTVAYSAPSGTFGDPKYVDSKDRWFSDARLPHQRSCNPGYEGAPPNCRPAPELWHLCFENNPCGLHAECEVENGTRRCPNCVPPAVGSPPRCVPPEGCSDVEKACGPNAICDARWFRPCFCAPGFVGDPPNCEAGPALLALCDPYPCGAHSDCHMQDGRPVCECARDFVGTPPRCEPSPEMWRVCFKDFPCGGFSNPCDMVDRVAVCTTCEPGYTGVHPFCYRTVT